MVVLDFLNFCYADLFCESFGWVDEFGGTGLISGWPGKIFDTGLVISCADGVIGTDLVISYIDGFTDAGIVIAHRDDHRGDQEIVRGPS